MADNGQATAAGPAPATAPQAAPALTATPSPETRATTAAPSVHSDDSHPREGGRPGGVNVKEAEAQFAELGRTLSQQSRAARGEKDLEADDDDFNLEDFLASTTSESSRAGIKRKRLGVVWDNVEVIGAGSMTLGVRTFPDAVVQNFGYPVFTLLKLFGVKLFDFGERKLLTGFEGALRPGEMCLVLGRPNAGCSTFLKTITHNHSGYGAVKGSIKYGGIDGGEFAEHYRGELVYNEEDDQHYPTLTVAETIMLALRLKTPGKRVEGQTAHDYRQQILTTILKMLNIEHTRDTKVGDAFVRGVSGGERKRVSIAEMLCSRASILAWDNASRGLDASTALDLAKSLRVLANIIQTPTFVTLYQAGEGIWEQFEKVLVIDDGRCVYFGPRTEARQYFIDLGFEDMPRQTSADYCTGCTDKYTRRFAEGHDESNTPSTPEQLEEAFRNSDIYKRMHQAKVDYEAEVAQDKSWTEEFKQAVAEDKARGVRKQSKYTVSFFEQVRALTIRQFCMIIGDKRDIFVSYATAIAVALIAGSLFYQLPVTSSGAFTRGGVLFISLLFNSLTAFSELPTQMGGRPILYRQTGFAFFRPSALTISQLAADVPLGVPRLTAFSLIVYFMAGLHYSAGAFFTFLINVIIAYYAFRALFALFGTVCESYDVAARLAAVIIVSLVVFAGYVAPRDAMPRWLFWISYINPVYYGECRGGPARRTAAHSFPLRLRGTDDQRVHAPRPALREHRADGCGLSGGPRRQPGVHARGLRARQPHRAGHGLPAGLVWLPALAPLAQLRHRDHLLPRPDGHYVRLPRVPAPRRL
jgi:ABC-type multidrug transport system ATPase subunit